MACSVKCLLYSHVFEGRDEDITEGDDLLSSILIFIFPLIVAHILMTQMLQKLQLSVGSFGQDRSGEGLHDLLHGDGLLSQLIFGGAASC